MNIKHTETATEMLDAIDTFMAGKPLTTKQRELQDRVFKAGAFAAAAFVIHAPRDGGECYAMTRSFLLALIDPLSEELDYLREDPETGPIAREERKSLSN